MRTYDKHHNSVMEPRFIWLLEAMCRNSGVDVQLIDPKLTYSENKDNIQRMTGIKLKLHGEARLKGIFHSANDIEAYIEEIDEDDLREWKAQEEKYDAFVGRKKGRKKDKKVPVDIGNIIRASGRET